MLCAAAALAQPARPRIFGIAHYATKVADIGKARAYYTGFLGFAEPFHLSNSDGSVNMAFIKINDYQYLELSPGLKADEDRLSHISFFTEDAEAMRRYLASKGIKVPDSVPKGRSGNLNFSVKDPDGHTVEIVQYMPDGWAMQNKGKYMPDSRVAQHILHVGVSIADANRAKAFYGGVLGFEEIWRAAAVGSPYVSWINMRVPDGGDYVEFMLYKDAPGLVQLNTFHHFCLESPNVAVALERVRGRDYSVTYGKAIEIKTGVNRRRLFNLFDPDGARLELMEPFTADGSVPVPTTLPLPR